MDEVHILMCIASLTVVISPTTIEQSCSSSNCNTILLSKQSDNKLHIVTPKPQVTGPYQQETVFPCNFFFEDKVAPESICLNWWRNESGHRRIIYAFENSQRQKHKEDPDYSNRTDLYYNLTLGYATLRLQNLTLQDAGLYVCEVWSEGHSLHAEGSVSLSVAARPSKQGFISAEGKFLSFNSSGWFPKPSVFWTNGEHQNVTEGTETNITLGVDGTYRIESVLHRNTSKAHYLYLCYTNPDTGEKQIDTYQQTETDSGIRIIITKPNTTGPYQGETVLTCTFNFDHGMPPVESIILHWWRQNKSTPIYFFKNNQRQKQEEDPDYSDRAELYSNINKWDASLKISNLGLHDSGKYTCDVWSEGYSIRVCDTVSLSVAAKPSKLGSISLKEKRLHFNSSGWFPQPSAFWTNENDLTVTERSQTNITQGEDELYSISTVLEPASGWKSRNLHLCYTNPDTGEKQTDKLTVYSNAAKSSGSAQGLFLIHITAIVISVFL